MPRRRTTGTITVHPSTRTSWTRLPIGPCGLGPGGLGSWRRRWACTSSVAWVGAWTWCGDEPEQARTRVTSGWQSGAMRVGILGPLEVVADGEIVEVGGARLRALLIRLALD